MSRIVDAKGYCDCCDQFRHLTRCFAAGGIETFACWECRGLDEMPEWEEDDELRYRTEMGEL
jgi:hypothetical protein